MDSQGKAQKNASSSETYYQINHDNNDVSHNSFQKCFGSIVFHF